MNLNELAKAVTSLEGKKQQINIAQIKEIIGAICRIFYSLGIRGTITLVIKMYLKGKEKFVD